MKIKIGGEELEIKPLKVKDLPLLMKLTGQDVEQQTEAMIKIIRKTLKEAVSDATDEDIDNVGVMHFKALSEAIMKVNGMDDDKQKSSVVKE